MRVPPTERHSGVFCPSQINEMRSELKRSDKPNESKADRELRAAAIIRHILTEPDKPQSTQLPV